MQLLRRSRTPKVKLFWLKTAASGASSAHSMASIGRDARPRVCVCSKEVSAFVATQLTPHAFDAAEVVPQSMLRKTGSFVFTSATETGVFAIAPSAA